MLVSLENDLALSSDRVAAVREFMRQHQLAGLMVPRSDEHLAEYAPPSASRLEWLTGFTGNVGVAFVLEHETAIFTSGLWIDQLKQETDGKLWERHLFTPTSAAQWLLERLVDGRLGYDPWLISEQALNAYIKHGLNCVALPANPIDRIWKERPGFPLHPALPYPIELAGETSISKRRRVAETLRDAGLSAAVLADPASIAWLLNIRGSDIPYLPVALGFALVHCDARVDLFMATDKLPQETRHWLGPEVDCKPREQLQQSLSLLSGKRVGVDTARHASWFSDTLRKAGATVVEAIDPCHLPKARKNDVEQKLARACHIDDGVALCRFLQWFETSPASETEMSCSAKLESLRQEMAAYKGPSFPAISSVGHHSASVLYCPDETSNRPICEDEIYLFDTGGQFLGGTTDSARAVWPGPSQPPLKLRDRYTRVLKGHIAVASLVFPAGICGHHIDSLSRVALWQVGLDFDQDTGHGVGSYLSVHEGPVRIGRNARPLPIEEGMILSIEPGCYEVGQFGVRLENLAVVVQAPHASQKRPFLRFDVLTLVPFDRSLIELEQLTAQERRWIDDYHEKIRQTLSPSLDPSEQEWLSRACRPLLDPPVER
ncbi:aminopeptidase P family protein [Roseibium sp. SCP14]|uniref:aminopeptidase P family protein n=1 Tax=Roseibium sp. SCP14 TaxID=3141375 RepID=UPI0033375823